MPINCHFRDCKALQITSLTHVSGAIASVQIFPFMAVLWNSVQTTWLENFLGLFQGLQCYKYTQMKDYDKYDKYVEYWRDLEMWVRSAIQGR